MNLAPGNRPRTLAAAIFSGLLFALAFPPFEWVLLLPLALVAWLVALGREQSPGRALLSGFLFGLAYWCASIPWIIYVVTHYGGQSGLMGIICLLLLAAILGVSIPVFLLAAVLLYLFAFKLPWFPNTGYVPLPDNPAQ